MKYVLIERLHRYVFDVIFIRDRKTNLMDKAIIFIYFKLTRRFTNWRYEFGLYCKRAIRYDKFNRLTTQ